MLNDKADWIARDLRHIWHPCSQMKDYEDFPPLLINKARGSYLMLADGRALIDAISSWWCKSLGHAHPRLKKALMVQAEKFEHVILANTSNNVIIELSERLSSLMPNLNKVSYASDGSCAVEMAMKMSLHSRVIRGQSQRHYFMSLSGDYHGETCAALSVSDLGIYKDAYSALLIDTGVIENIPYVTGREDPLWDDCSEYWKTIETQLSKNADRLTAIVIEPILQGANGMRIYSRDLLVRLRQWTKENDVHLIADEILTGFGRTGLALACQHANIEPDFLCLGKGLTAGWLPMSAMITHDPIYQLFYDDYEKGKSFLHSHTFTGNALAAAVALEVFSIIDDEHIYQKALELESQMTSLMQAIAQDTGKLKNIRAIGGVVAADLIVDDSRSRHGYAVYRKAVELGALLRPLGNTIYWMPPLNIEEDTLKALQSITARALFA